MNERRTAAAVITVCSVALLAPLVYPLLAGLVFVNNDLEWFHLPTRYLYQQALRAGDTVLWTPSIFAGLYLHGEGQVGMFHPFHQLLYRLFPLGLAFNLELITNYLAAFAGTCWFLHRVGISRAAALFGAMLFAFSGFNLLHHQHINMVAVVAHMPWLLAVTDVLIVEERKRARALAFAGMALILGSEFLIGFPQGVWWNAMALAAFSVFRAGQTRRWKQLLPCAGGVAVGVLLGGLQLLPTADMVAHSTRMEHSDTFPLSFSLHPLNLFQLWSPYFFIGGSHGGASRVHEYGMYSGAVMLISLIWVWLRRDALRERRALVVAVTVFSAVSMLLALGPYGGIVFLLTKLPVLHALRAPARYIVLVQFALTILAAITIDDLLAIADGRSPAANRRMALLWIPAALGIVTTLAFNTRWLPYGPHTFASATDAAPGVAMVMAVTLAIHLAGRRVRWAIAALVVLTAVDLGAWGIRFVYRDSPRAIADLAEAAPPAPAAIAESYAFVQRPGPYASDVLVLRGYRLTSGYAGLFPATQHPLEGDAAIRLTGTRWLFTPDGVRHPVGDAVERVRLLDDQGHATTGAARLVDDRPGRLVATVDAPGRRVVAFTERFHDGWSATSDGVPLQMVRVEGDFLGCVLEPGLHQVTLRFMPRSFVYGSIMSGLGAVLLVCVLLLQLK